MYIKFNGNDTKFSCSIEWQNDDIRVIFDDEFEIGLDGFRCFTDSGKCVAKYDDYIYATVAYEDGYLFSREKQESKAEIKESLGKQLEKAVEKIELLESELQTAKEALEQTDNMLEELLFKFSVDNEEVSA